MAFSICQETKNVLSSFPEIYLLWSIKYSWTQSWPNCLQGCYRTLADVSNAGENRIAGEKKTKNKKKHMRTIIYRGWKHSAMCVQFSETHFVVTVLAFCSGTLVLKWDWMIFRLKCWLLIWGWGNLTSLSLFHFKPKMMDCRAKRKNVTVYIMDYSLKTASWSESRYTGG